MWCGAERYGAVWDEHKKRTGESGMDKGFVWRNGQRQKPRGACENDCGSALHTTTTVKCKRQN